MVDDSTATVSASPAPAANPQATDSAASDLAHLRDVLFGDQKRQMDQQVQELEARVDAVRRELTELMDDRISAQAETSSEWLAATRQDVAERLAQQAAHLDAFERHLTDLSDAQVSAQASRLQAAHTDLAERVAQISAAVEAIAISLAEFRQDARHQLGRQAAQLQSIEQRAMASIGELNTSHAAHLKAVQEDMERQLRQLKTDLHSRLQALSMDMTQHIDRLAEVQSQQNNERVAPRAPRTVKEAGGWVRAIRSWKHVKSDPETAQKLVRFFRLAFEWLPEQSYQAAWFGVHADHISLTLGNVQLASVSATTRRAQLLVDAKWHRSAKSTRRTIPLGWRLRTWARLAGWLESSDAWVSYAAAAEKVWAAPHARAVIRRDLAHKNPLRRLLRRAARSR